MDDPLKLDFATFHTHNGLDSPRLNYSVFIGNPTYDQIVAGLGYVPEDVANKSTNTALGNSNILYPTQKAVKDYVDNFAFVDGNYYANQAIPSSSQKMTTYMKYVVSTYTTTGTFTPTVNGLSTANAGGTSWSFISNTAIWVQSSGTAVLRWNQNPVFRIRFSAAIIPTAAQDPKTWIGLASSAATDVNADPTSSTNERVCISYFDDDKLHAITSDGVGVTATTILDPYTTKAVHDFIIDYSSTSVKFYMDSVLVATHTTNIPNTSTDILLGGGGNALNPTQGGGFFSDILLSI